MCCQVLQFSHKTVLPSSLVVPHMHLITFSMVVSFSFVGSVQEHFTCFLVHPTQVVELPRLLRQSMCSNRHLSQGSTIWISPCSSESNRVRVGGGSSPNHSGTFLICCHMKFSR